MRSIASRFAPSPQPTAKLAAGPFLKELAEEATDPRVRIELIQCVADMYRVWGDRLDVVNERTGKGWTVWPGFVTILILV